MLFSTRLLKYLDTNAREFIKTYFEHLHLLIEV